MFFGGLFSFSTRLASTKKIRLEMEGRVPAKLVFGPDRVNQVRVEFPGAYVGGGVERTPQVTPKNYQIAARFWRNTESLTHL